MFDLVVKNAEVVRPGQETERLEIGIADGKFTQLAPTIEVSEAREVFDAGRYP